MRADRLLSIMLLLQVHRRMTAREFARRLEVSERTIHRDMDALSAAGIPVVAERGAGGGWTLLDEYRTNLTGLNTAEVRALFMTKPARLLADLGLDKAADAAVIKLLAALPSVARRGAEYARQRIYVDVTGWHESKEAIPCLTAIQEAIWQERQLRFTYKRGDDTVERVVNPLGLVAKASIWYLVAAVAGDIRSYRVSRVRRADICAEPCERPADFDLARYWERSQVEFRSNLPRYPVRLRVAPQYVDNLGRSARFARVEAVEASTAPSAAGTQPATAQDWVTVQMVFQFEYEACEFILGCGSEVEVLEPVELRGKIVERARSVIAFYEERAS